MKDLLYIHLNVFKEYLGYALSKLCAIGLLKHNPYKAQFQLCRNSWLSLLTHKFQMMQATVCQVCGNHIL